MTFKHMKRCAISLDIRKMQNKTTVLYHFTLISITMTNSGKQKIGVREGVEQIETLIHC